MHKQKQKTVYSKLAGRQQWEQSIWWYKNSNLWSSSNLNTYFKLFMTNVWFGVPKTIINKTDNKGDSHKQKIYLKNPPPMQFMHSCKHFALKFLLTVCYKLKFAVGLQPNLSRLPQPHPMKDLSNTCTGVLCIGLRSQTCLKHRIWTERNPTTILPSLPAVNSCCLLTHTQARCVRVCTHENIHASATAFTSPPTFLQGLANLDVAVCSLELIEEGTHFELIRDALSELRDHGAVLCGGPHLKHRPFALLGALWRRPVHHPVALGVLGLLLHLESGKGEVSLTWLPAS